MVPRLPDDSDFSAYSPEEIERLCFSNVLRNPEERAFFKDRQSRFVLVSKGWLDSFGKGTTLEDVIGKTDFDFFPEADANYMFSDEQYVMETGLPIIKPIERDLIPGGGSDTWLHVIKQPLRDADGKIIGTWGVTRDITAQRDAELALHAREQQYRSLFEHNPQPMMAYTKDGMRIVAVSNACVAAYGYSREEFLEMTVRDLVPPDTAGTLTGGARTGYMAPLQCRHRYKDGTVVDVEVTSDDLTLDGQECRVALCLNVTERNRTLAELAVARDAAVEASKMKSAFLANISHEIRTPMAGVLGMADLLLDGDLDEDERSLVAEISRSGEQMVELINDILDISKIEAGQLALEESDFALRDTIEQACAGFRVRAAAKEIGFDLEIAKEVPGRVRGDGQRLRQIILNLVSNAVKFTSQGGVSVRASAPQTDDEEQTLVRIEVADTGIGIEPSVLNRMFEPFTQADSSTTRHYGGTGLGLAICRELSDLMGGTVNGASKPGAGSTFWIDIPFAAAIGEEPDIPEPADNGEPVSWATPPLVLVAEDNPVNQKVAVRTLERCGCEIDVVANGREALEALAARRYDAVLMDCQMPVMDGYDATTELRKRERNGGRRTPVIAMTAHAMNGAAERCLAAGMDDYIAKPVRRAQLIEALRRWIGPPSDLTSAAGQSARPS